MIKNFKIFKFAAILCLYIIIFSNAYADKIKSVLIQGNNRVADETIIMFSDLDIGEEINQQILNKSLKELYSTNYFKDVKILNKNGNIIINVVENPIIQTVIINGVEKDNIYDKIKDITLKIEKYPFVESKVNEQVNLLKNILKSYGYYFVELKTSIINNNNNTVDLVYDFNLGEITKYKN